MQPIEYSPSYSPSSSSRKCNLLTESVQKKEYFSHFFPMAVLLCIFLLVGSPYVINYKKLTYNYGFGGSARSAHNSNSSLCVKHDKPLGSETLPEGIISRTSNLEMQSTEYFPSSSLSKEFVESSKSLLAIAVGIKQKKVVNEIIRKFLKGNFAVMLFHYDGTVDEWRDLDWSDNVLHVSAINQTKWWFAKRFLHPDIVSQYNYIFLWDEDLGVENFNPERRTYKFHGGGRCYENSTAPPCTGWVEMMAPVFSRDAWRCVWHMIQNDLIHAWGLDTKLGYCSQGDRTKKVGVVDSEYIIHMGIPSLGGDSTLNAEVRSLSYTSNPGSVDSPNFQAQPALNALNDRLAIRRRSYMESEMFQRRWQDAVDADECWVDPYKFNSTS